MDDGDVLGDRHVVAPLVSSLGDVFATDRPNGSVVWPGGYLRRVSARGVRRTMVVVCVLAVIGMIVSSIVESTGAAITFGLVAAVAVVCLILVTATAGPRAFGAPGVDDVAAADVERRVQALATAGADEPELRALVRAARRMERRVRG
jgi:hypothetical protein